MPPRAIEKAAVPLYRVLERVASFDVALVVMAEGADTVRAGEARGGVDGVELALFDAHEMQCRAARGEPGFAAAVPLGLADGDGDVANAEDGAADATSAVRAYCACALHEGRVVGYQWFALGTVPPSLNRGKPTLRGIGLSLPEGACYLFKSFVDPDWRGRSLLGALVAHGISRLPGAPCSTVVDTTDWSNTAARGARRKGGFAVRGWSAEVALGPLRPARLPRPIPLASGGAIEFFT